MASLGAVIIKCLVCDDEMPPIRLVVAELSMRTGSTVPDVKLVVEPVIDEAWYEQTRVEHEDCMYG